MKIITFLNVSNRSRIQADSGYIFYDLLSPFFSKNNEFYFVSPEPLSDKKSFFIKREYGFNKYEVRFSFDWEYYSGLISMICPDIIIVNQVELVPHFRAVVEALGIKTAVVSYAHYIPFLLADGKIIYDDSLNNSGLGIAVCNAFLSGLVLSDLVFTHSAFSKNMLMDFLKQKNVLYDKSRIIINPPPFDTLLIDNNQKHTNEVIYNHRLYKHYGSDFFYELANFMSEIDSINIKVLDVLGERSEIQDRMDPSVTIIRKKLKGLANVTFINDTYDRKKYKKELKNSFFSIAPYRLNCIWSMSCIDSLGMGVPVISPNIAWYKEIIPSSLRFNNIVEAKSIIYRLYDNDFWNECSSMAQNSIKRYSPEIVSNVFLTYFSELNNKI